MTTADTSTIVCPGCQRPYGLNAKRAGRTIKCWCGQSITFPGANARLGPSVRDQDVDDMLNESQAEKELDRAGFVASLLTCIVLSIPLSFFGIIIHPTFRSNKAKTPMDMLKSLVFIFTLIGTSIAFIVIAFKMHLTLDKLNSNELTLALGTIIGGGLLTLIVTAIRPFAGFLAGGLAVGGMFLACQHIQDNRNALTAALGPRLFEYARLHPSTVGYTGAEQIAFHGKVIVVDPATADVDNLYYLMPPELQAHVPADVGTIIWIKRGEQVLGQYEGHTGKGIRRFADVTFINNSKTPRLICHQTFTGGDPPSKGKNEDLYGSAPDDAIIAFIQKNQRN